MLVPLLLAGCTSLSSLYFFPQTAWVQTPSALGLDYEDVYLTAEDKTSLHAWWLKASVDVPRPDAPVVLHLHGNAQNISTHIMSIAWLPKAGVDVVTLDYRGFGASSGSANLPSVLMDVEAAVSWIHNRFPERKIAILGQSIGGAVSVPFVALAQNKYPIESLVLEGAPFAMDWVARDMMSRTWIGWIVWPFTWLLPTDWNPEQWAEKMTVPVMVIHSPDDQIVDVEQGQAMYEAITSEKCWVDASGRHIGGFREPSVRGKVLMFLVKASC